MISHEWAQRTSEISCSTREMNLVFPSTHVFFCLLYKQNSVKNNKTSVAMRFTTNDISHVKISYFLRVFKYDFSQWPKTLYNTYVYIIKLITNLHRLAVRGRYQTSVLVYWPRSIAIARSISLSVRKLLVFTNIWIVLCFQDTLNIYFCPWIVLE
jgi:hypothetical protein